MKHLEFFDQAILEALTRKSSIRLLQGIDPFAPDRQGYAEGEKRDSNVCLKS